MKAGLSTIQQTLTPEAATVLNQSIGEAGRRNHGQTSPLHVAATLLSSPSGVLRQACIRSHPNSSHPLQCRALELCFSVALERLPTSQSLLSPEVEPPISNALLAALKRAQAHQRRGCPEQQQQPLLAVKVELEQLIISILDDPSVSRVMRKASFSSPAVKATIEQTLNSQAQASSLSHNPSIGLSFRPHLMAAAGSAGTGSAGAAPSTPRNLYLNPRLQQTNATQSGNQRTEDVIKVIEILSRTKKKNPVLVGDSEPDSVVKEVLKRIENKEVDQEALRNLEVIHLQKDMALDRTQIPNKIRELGITIENRISSSTGCNGVVLDLGDLKWLVEQQQSGGSTGVLAQQAVSETGRASVTEMSNLLRKFDVGSAAGRVMLIGTATCETYSRCQVYHSTMETDWDLQAVPITAKTPLSGMFSRLGTSGNLSSAPESLTSIKSFQTKPVSLQRRLSESSDPSPKASCCPQCMQSYEQELAKLVGKDPEKSSSETNKAEAAKPSLPIWLQNAKSQNNDITTTDQTPAKDQELIVKHQTQELQKKWNGKCLSLHPSFNKSPVPTPMPGLYSQNLLNRQPFQPKLSLGINLGQSLQLKPTLTMAKPSESLHLKPTLTMAKPSESLQVNPALMMTKPNERAERAPSPQRSPVRTELALGQTKESGNTPEKTHQDWIQDLLGCISSETQHGALLQNVKLMTNLEADFADEYKKLLKGLSQRVWWQPDAAAAVASTVTQRKLSSGKRQGVGGTRGDIWLFFTGPDRVGKKKMAHVLSDQGGGAYPIIIPLGSRRSYEESNTTIRGKTVLDRIAEAVRRNPFSVIILEDVDEADLLIRGSIKRAMERGRLADSHGREISLGNVIFILTTNWLPDNLKSLSYNLSLLDEEKLAISAGGGWQLRLAISAKIGKRRANWLLDEDRSSTKPRKDNSCLAFDLNETADLDDGKAGGAPGSLNSSDLTVDNALINLSSPNVGSPSRELLNAADDSIVFKPVDSAPVRTKFCDYLSTTFSTIIDESFRLEVQEEALEKILGGVWLGRIGLEEWTEKYLVPSFRQLKSRLPVGEAMVVKLELDGDESIGRGLGDWLPSKVNIVVDE